jgi:hypothetical protein
MDPNGTLFARCQKKEPKKFTFQGPQGNKENVALQTVKLRLFNDLKEERE